MSKLSPEELEDLLNTSIPSGSETSFCSSDDDDDEFTTYRSNFDLEQEIIMNNLNVSINIYLVIQGKKLFFSILFLT